MTKNTFIPYPSKLVTLAKQIDFMGDMRVAYSKCEISETRRRWSVPSRVSYRSQFIICHLTPTPPRSTLCPSSTNWQFEPSRSQSQSAPSALQLIPRPNSSNTPRHSARLTQQPLTEVSSLLDQKTP